MVVLWFLYTLAAAPVVCMVHYGGGSPLPYAMLAWCWVSLLIFMSVSASLHVALAPRARW